MNGYYVMDYVIFKFCNEADCKPSSNPKNEVSTG